MNKLSVLVMSFFVVLFHVHAADEIVVKRPVDVVFVLDSTGSMSGLIEGAKAKIWSIANDIITLNGGESLNVGLVSYRDRGDAYVTKHVSLSSNIDEIFVELQKIQAQGGGDTPESVNQALNEAVMQLQWRKDSKVLKMVFLVGDCPAHMDYQDDVKYPVTCEAAVQSDIIINTVICGENSETRVMWQHIAKLGKGSFAAISQSGGMQNISTPYDQELSDKMKALNATALFYGSAGFQSKVAGLLRASESSIVQVQADRVAYNSNMGGKVIQADNDLVDEYVQNKLELDSIGAHELPKKLKGKTREEQEKIIHDLSVTRKEINLAITDITKKRQDYIAEQKKKNATLQDGFDQEVKKIISEQLLRKVK